MARHTFIVTSFVRQHLSISASTKFLGRPSTRGIVTMMLISKFRSVQMAVVACPTAEVEMSCWLALFHCLHMLQMQCMIYKSEFFHGWQLLCCCCCCCC